MNELHDSILYTDFTQRWDPLETKAYFLLLIKEDLENVGSGYVNITDRKEMFYPRRKSDYSSSLGLNNFEVISVPYLLVEQF